MCVCVKGTPALNVSFCTKLAFSQQTLILDFQPDSCTSAREEQTLVPALSICQEEVVQCRPSLCVPAHICMSACGVLTRRRLLNMFNKLSDETDDKSCKGRRIGQGQNIVKRRFSDRDITP